MSQEAIEDLLCAVGAFTRRWPFVALGFGRGAKRCARDRRPRPARLE
jgi:hypothetical protein